MVIEFRCPGCREEYEVEEAYGGRRWRCPNCSADFVIPEGRAVPAERPARRRHEENLDDSPAAAPDRDPAWLTYRSGLRIMTLGVLVFLISYVVFVAVILITPLIVKPVFPGDPRRGQGWGDLLLSTGLVFLVATVASVILWFVGQAMSCAVPARSGAKGTTVASLILTAAGLLVAVGGGVALYLKPREVPNPFVVPQTPWQVYLVLLGLVILFAGHFTCVLSLRNVGLFFRNRAVAVNTLIYLGLFLAWVMASVGVSLFSDTLQNALDPAPVKKQAAGMMAVSVALLCVELVLFGYFIYLLAATRSGLPRPGAEPGQPRVER